MSSRRLNRRMIPVLAPMRIMGLMTALVLGSVLGLPGPVIAHDGATGIIKQRHDAMKSLGQTMKAWKAVLDAGSSSDQAEVKAIADRLAAAAGSRLLALFPKDGPRHMTAAQPIIWTQWDVFDRLAMALDARAVSLAKARSDIVLLRSEFKAVGQICRECHDRFRKR